MNGIDRLRDASATIPIDEYVGKRLTAARVERGLSQSALGEQLGVSGRIIGEFEDGTRRIGTRYLMRLCQLIDKGLTYFFQGRVWVDCDDELEIEVAELPKILKELPQPQRQMAVRFIKELDSRG